MFIDPAFNNTGRRGWVEVICGPMFSGKTEELIRRVNRARIANQKVIIFKPSVDKRYSKKDVVSHDRNNLASRVIKKPMEIFDHLSNSRVVAIDEAQFFDHSLVQVVQHMALSNIRVILAGLDMDYSGKSFTPMPDLMAVAEFVTKVHAICLRCGSLATHSFRKLDNDERILVGEKETYEPRCRKCFQDGIAVGREKGLV